MKQEDTQQLQTADKWEEALEIDIPRWLLAHLQQAEQYHDKASVPFEIVPWLINYLTENLLTTNTEYDCKLRDSF